MSHRVWDRVWRSRLRHGQEQQSIYAMGERVMTQYLTVPMTVPMYVYDLALRGNECLTTAEDYQYEISELEEFVAEWTALTPERVIAVLVPLDENGEPTGYNSYVTPVCVRGGEECFGQPVVGFTPEETMTGAKNLAESRLLMIQNMLRLRAAGVQA